MLQFDYKGCSISLKAIFRILERANYPKGWVAKPEPKG